MTTHKLKDLIANADILTLHSRQWTVPPELQDKTSIYILLRTTCSPRQTEVVSGEQEVELLGGSALVLLEDEPGRKGTEVAMSFFKYRLLTDEDVKLS